MKRKEATIFLSYMTVLTLVFWSMYLDGIFDRQPTASLMLFVVVFFLIIESVKELCIQ